MRHDSYYDFHIGNALLFSYASDFEVLDFSFPKGKILYPNYFRGRYYQQSLR